MRRLRPLLVLIGAIALVSPMLAQTEPEQGPSLGDVARQAKLQKQQKNSQQKGTQPGKDASAANPTDAGAQSKGAPSKDATSAVTGITGTGAKAPQLLKAKKVITNEEIPEHVGPTRTLAPGSVTPEEEDSEQREGESKAPPDYWRARILSEKNSIAALKSDIDSLSASIQYAGGNCVSGCVQWNERQQQKQQQVEAMKSQLEQEQKQLEDMQEMARKQGYGSSVYDP